MATFLVTSKMNSALAERIGNSVRGRRGDERRLPKERLRPVIVALLRLLAVMCVGAIALTFILTRRTLTQEREAARADLLRELQAAAAPLKERHRHILTRAQLHLQRASGSYQGDHIAPSLREAGMPLILEQPSVYVRGALGVFNTSEGTQRAVLQSEKDALLLCFIDPPSNFDATAQEQLAEKELLDSVYVAQRRGEPLEERTSNIYRLQRAVTTVELLSDAWIARVQRAESSRNLQLLRRTFDAAPIAPGVQAAQARFLIFALDEPKEPDTPSSFDGGTAHHIRVGVVDLDSDETLLRVRRRVDPADVSEKKRLHFARGINGCRLGLELRRSVQRRTPSPQERP